MNNNNNNNNNLMTIERIEGCTFLLGEDFLAYKVY